MNPSSQMLAPVIALVIWTAVIWAWMYATRIPAVLKARMVLDSMAPRGDQMAQLPASVRWKADNYNHLMELPTAFYAVAISLAVLGDTSYSSLVLAWGYVVLRVVHSLVQTLWNHIPTRFALFFVSSLVLFGLTYKAAILVF
ncbi:MAG: MAPEG family protein [Arenimonas sp.]